MKRRCQEAGLAVCFSAALAALLATGCGGAAERDKAKDDTGGASHAELRREKDGSVVITFGEEATSRLELNVAEAAASTLAPETRAYGRVLDPAGLVALVSEERKSSSDLEIAEKELARSKRLVGDQNVSGRDFEAATAAAAQARVALQDVRSRLMMGWGNELAARSDLAQLAAALVSGEAALVRVDLPTHAALALRGVHVSFVDTPDDEIAASLLGAAPDVDAKVQGQGFLALVRPNPRHLASGAFVLASLELEGKSLAAALVPRSAVVRAESKAWVYLQAAGEGTYHRVEVSLDRATPAGWLVTRGVSPGQRLVVEGAQQLLSEEALASGRAGD